MAVNISDAFKAMLEDDARNYLCIADIVLKDGTRLTVKNENLWSGGWKVEDAVSGESAFQIGAAIINKFTLILNNMYKDYNGYDFRDAEIKPRLELKLPDGTIETVKKGVFHVDDAHGDDLLTLECLDNMAKFDRDYDSTLPFPATLGTILRDCCTRCGVVLNTTSFTGSDIVVVKRPDSDNLTYRQMIAWAAQRAGKWARCNTLGQLELGWYDMATLAADEPAAGSYHDIHSLSSFTKSDDDVVITGIRVAESTEISGEEGGTYLYGSTGYVLEISGNELIQSGDGNTAAAWLGEKLIGMRFRPLNVSFLDNPAIEAGDVAIVTDANGSKYRTVVTGTTFTAGNYQNVVCGAESPGYKSSTRYSNETKTYVELRKAIRAEKTSIELAVENLGNLLSESSGMYVTEEKQGDGSTITYLHDKPTLGASKNVIKITAEAIGVSNDGGKTYPYGFVLTGEMIARILQTEGVNADWINTGAISIKDDNGAVIFQVDMDTGQVLLSGDCVKIGGQTAAQAVQDAKDVAASAKNMTMQLKNDYQSIPVNSSGVYQSFPECTTIPTVMYGTADVTKDCSFTIIKSDTVTGSWNNAAKTYSVTGLSADTGWVDIKATYLVSLSVTRRFTISKLYAGANGAAGAVGPAGADGRSYLLEPTASMVKIEKENTLSPSYITFSAYYRDGADAIRSPYSGRFIIEETSDGAEWKTAYVSSTDEIRVSHLLYDIIVDNDGSIISDADGAAIADGDSRTLSSVRCTLCAAGGTTQVIERVEVSFVKEVEALTQEEVVNILTNQGAWKGLFYLNGRLYISFDAALGGMLTLGGVNNGNGKLNIADASGKIIGYIDNTGVNFEKGYFSGILRGGRVESAVIEGSNMYSGYFSTTTKDYNGSYGFIQLYGANAYFGSGQGINSKNYPMYEYWLEEGYVEVKNYSAINLFLNQLATVEMNGAKWLTITSKAMDSVEQYYDAEHNPIYNGFNFHKKITAKNLDVTGTKSRLVEDTRYGDLRLYSYETPTPYFGDIGTGRLDESGECIVSIDAIFAETIDQDIEYCVFLQKEGPGDIWIETKEQEFFIAKGTPSLAFSWELKTVQKNFETLRLDDEALTEYGEDDSYELEKMFSDELKEYDAEMEEWIHEGIESIPSD